MKLLALDGNSIINRAFYGIRILTTKDGTFTNAIYGFLNIVLKLKDQCSPDAVAAAFDLRAPTFRHQMYEGYKAGRKGMPDELAMQMPILKKLLPLCGISVLEQAGFEADDILGTLARQCCESGDTCIIATGDRDSLQLVSDCVTVCLAATRNGQPELTCYDEKAILEQYGLTPSQLIELKALMGDASDKIPGVAGVGEKTALSLLHQFGTLDGVYENIDSPDIRETLRSKLSHGRDNAYLSRKLGTIVTDVPLAVTLPQLAAARPDREALAAALAKLELFRLIDRMDLKQQPLPVSDTPASELLCHVDESIPDVSADRPVFLLIGAENEQICAACAVIRDELYLFTQNAAEAVHALCADAPVITHDCKALFRFEPDARVQGDTLLAAYLLNPSAPSYDLPRLYMEHPAAQISLAGAPESFSELCKNTARLPALYTLLHEQIEACGQEKLLQEMELPFARVLAGMEEVGFAVDREGLIAFGQMLSGRIDEITERIYREVGYEFNLNSPKQLGEALFEKLGLPAKKKTKSGYSTAAEVLEELKYEHPAVEWLLEYRQLAKLKSTYADGLVAAIAPDGRIHSTLNQTETRTGRISSAEPNLQNIPVRKELGRELRRFFLAREGCVLVDADYSQIELRVLAHAAQDKAMIAAFCENADIHTATAASVFHVPEELVTPLMRTRAKAVNFGIVYGIGAYSLSRDLSISYGEAKEYIRQYLTTYRGVAEYMEHTVELAKDRGYAETMFARRRLLPELKSGNAATRAFGERVARNMPIQGTAADIIKIAMIRVCRRIEQEKLSARLIMQVHDELIVECPVSEQERVSEILRHEMENAVSLSVPLLVDLHCGRTWFDAKE